VGIEKRVKRENKNRNIKYKRKESGEVERAFKNRPKQRIKPMELEEL